MTLLRPYQQTAIDAIRDSYANRHRAPLLVMPTGAGKTVAFSYIAANAAAKQKRVTILAHRAELLDQISEALARESVTHGFIAAGHPSTDHPVQVASVQTLVRRTSSVTAPDLIICDEAHHATASNSYGKILAAYPQARRLGVTATPCRLSGEALGDVFDDLILGPSVAELTEQGYLTPARIFAPPTVDVSGLHTRAGEFVASEVAERVQKPSVTGSAVDHYRQHAHGLAAVCFCHSVEHSQYMAEAFRQAGYVAAHLDGNTPREIRRAMVNDLRAGTLHVLCSVDVVSEGFDAPGIHCGILLRPTASESLYLQQIGRCLRPAPGKSAAIILDHVGSTLRHGLPSDDREWTLTGKQASHRKKRDADDLPVRVCLRCFAAQRPASACRQCGAPFPVKSRQVDERAGQLKELTADELAARRVRRDARRQVGRAQSLEDLQEIEKARGYKPGWARHVFEAKKRKQENVNGTDGRIGAEGN